MKKKILILTLALLATLTLIPVSATVDDDDQPPAASTFVTVSIINLLNLFVHIHVFSIA